MRKTTYLISILLTSHLLLITYYNFDHFAKFLKKMKKFPEFSFNFILNHDSFFKGAVEEPLYQIINVAKKSIPENENIFFVNDRSDRWFVSYFLYPRQVYISDKKMDLESEQFKNFAKKRDIKWILLCTGKDEVTFSAQKIKF